VAEELVFGHENVTSGAASDIQQVSRIARAMVTQFGFSDQLGNIDYANEQQSYLGAYQGPSSISPDSQKKIDEEVKRIVDEGYETAKRILTEQRDELERLAQGLLEYETLTGPEIGRVIRGEPLADHARRPGMVGGGAGTGPVHAVYIHDSERAPREGARQDRQVTFGPQPFM
jgi:cell division protease FtsH